MDKILEVKKHYKVVYLTGADGTTEREEEFTMEELEKFMEEGQPYIKGILNIYDRWNSSLRTGEHPRIIKEVFGVTVKLVQQTEQHVVKHQ